MTDSVIKSFTITYTEPGGSELLRQRGPNDFFLPLGYVTYVAKALTCPACGSVTDAAICRKCNQRRRLKEDTQPWSLKPEYCAKWQALADERNQPARRQLSSQFIALGRKTYQGLLSQYARCLKHQVWPGYDLDEKGDEIWPVVDLKPWMEQGRADTATPPTAEPGATAASAPRSE